MSATRWLPAHQRVKGVPDCEECGGVGIIPPGMRAVRICGCRGYTQDLEGACKAIADKIMRINPDYASKMRAAMDERHWTYTQLIGAALFYVYERDAQMSMPNNPFFREGAAETPDQCVCALPSCGKAYTPRFPGDKFCSNECGVLALPKRKLAKQPEPEVTPLPAQHETEVVFPVYSEHDELADA